MSLSIKKEEAVGEMKYSLVPSLSLSLLFYFASLLPIPISIDTYRLVLGINSVVVGNGVWGFQLPSLPKSENLRPLLRQA